MIRKSVLMSWNIIREHKGAFIIGTLVPALFGILLGETVMAPMFYALQPILHGMTLILLKPLGL